MNYSNFNIPFPSIFLTYHKKKDTFLLIRYWIVLNRYMGKRSSGHKYTDSIDPDQPVSLCSLIKTCVAWLLRHWRIFRQTLIRLCDCADCSRPLLLEFSTKTFFAWCEQFNPCPAESGYTLPMQTSEEANWSIRTVCHYVNLYKKSRSRDLIGWKLEVGVAS